MGWCSSKMETKINYKISSTLQVYEILHWYFSSQHPIHFPPSQTHMGTHSLHTLDHVKCRSATEGKFCFVLQSLHDHHGMLTRTSMGLSTKVSSNIRNMKNLVYFSDKCNMLLIQGICKIINYFEDNSSYSCYSGWIC